MQVESRLRFSISASAVNARNMVSNVPSSRHLANRAYTDCQGPYASGNSRHCAPLRTIQSIPLSIFRSSFRGRPRFPVLPAGSNFFTRSHCAFVNSYRFMALFSHFYLVCAIFIFQTSPKRAAYLRKPGFPRPHRFRYWAATVPPGTVAVPPLFHRRGHTPGRTGYKGPHWRCITKLLPGYLPQSEGIA